MPKRALLTVGGVHRKIQKGYITLDKTYRKIKKAYLTIGGVYRPCMGSRELEYYGKITPLSQEKWLAGTASIEGKYALFVGGSAPGSIFHTNSVEAYDPLLSRTVTTVFDNWRDILGTQVGDYALFGGGLIGTRTDAVVAFSSSLVISYPDNTLSEEIHNHAVASVGKNKYALFAGGGWSSNTGDYCQNIVDAYDSSLTSVPCPTLENKKAYLTGVTFGDYAIFAGGWDAVTNTKFSDVEAFDPQLTKHTLENLDTAYFEGKGASIGDKYALFVKNKQVEAYDSSLTKLSTASIAEFSISRENFGAVSSETCALFAGGRSNITNGTYSDGTPLSLVEAYDRSLTKTLGTNLNKARYFLSAARIGDYALFAGGVDANDEYDIVDAYLLPEID